MQKLQNSKTKHGWVFVYELSGCGFKSSCSHLNFIFRTCFEQGVPWHSGNCRVWIHSETSTRYDKNIQTKYVAVRIPSQKGRFYYKSKILFALFIYQRKFSLSDFVHYILEDIFDLIIVHRPTTIDCTQRTNLLTALNYYLRKYTD